MSKLLEIESCIYCYYLTWIGNLTGYCSKINNTFTKEEHEVMIHGIFPSWCPLPDKKEEVKK